MKKQKLLSVSWNETEGSCYLVDKDKYSVAHDRKGYVTLNAWEGTYFFDKETQDVALDDGVKKRPVTVKSWLLYEVDAE